MLQDLKYSLRRYKKDIFLLKNMKEVFSLTLSAYKM